MPAPINLKFALGSVLLLLSTLAGCPNEPSGNAFNNNVPPGCVVDGTCESHENCMNCPADCCRQCDLASVQSQVPRDYLVSAMLWPQSREETLAYGLDLDGDLEVDNKGGYTISAFEGTSDRINERVAHRIASGQLLLLLRVYAENLSDDDEVVVQLLPAEIVDATPVFNGNDVVAITPGQPRDAFACGAISSGVLETDPAREPHRIPSPIGIAEDGWLTFQRLRVAAVMHPEGLEDVVLAGGLGVADVLQVLLSEITVMVNDEIAENPGPGSEPLVQLLDGNCVQMANTPGCENVVAGQGPCSDTEDPPVITYTEVLCNALLSSAVSPDFDSDGDGAKDLLSIGWRFSAVPVTVVD